jgi:hypothetical protein
MSKIITSSLPSSPSWYGGSGTPRSRESEQAAGHEFRPVDRTGALFSESCEFCLDELRQKKKVSVCRWCEMFVHSKCIRNMAGSALGQCKGPPIVVGASLGTPGDRPKMQRRSRKFDLSSPRAEAERYILRVEIPSVSTKRKVVWTNATTVRLVLDALAESLARKGRVLDLTILSLYADARHGSGLQRLDDTATLTALGIVTEMTVYLLREDEAARCASPASPRSPRGA